jgi:hypothetical protein
MSRQGPGLYRIAAATGRWIYLNKCYFANHAHRLGLLAGEVALMLHSDQLLSACPEVLHVTRDEAAA